MFIASNQVVVSKAILTTVATLTAATDIVDPVTDGEMFTCIRYGGTVRGDENVYSKRNIYMTVTSEIVPFRFFLNLLIFGVHSQPMYSSSSSSTS